MPNKKQIAVSDLTQPQASELKSVDDALLLRYLLSLDCNHPELVLNAEEDLVNSFRSEWEMIKPHHATVLAAIDFLKGHLKIERHPEVLQHNSTFISTVLTQTVSQAILNHVSNTHDSDLLQKTLPHLRTIRMSEGVTDNPQSLISFRLLEQALKLNAPFTLDHIDNVVFGGTLKWGAFSHFLLPAMGCKTISDLTVDIVRSHSRIPIYARHLDLSYSIRLPADVVIRLPADVVLAIINWIKPNGSVNLKAIDLSSMTAERVNELLPTPPSVNDLDLRLTNLQPDALLTLLSKLNPNGSVNLKGINLLFMPAKRVNELLPTSLSVNDLDLHRTKLQPKPLLTLLSKLNPKGSVDLSRNNLSTLTVKQINDHLPTPLSVKDLNLDGTNLQPDVESALRLKLMGTPNA